MAVNIFSYTVRDADGNERAVPIYCTLTGTLTITQLNAISVAISAVLDDVLDGQIVKGTLTLGMDLDSGIKASPVAGSNVQETGLLSFSADGTVYTYSIDIPAFFQNGFAQDTIILDQTQVENFTNFVTTSASGFTGSDKYENALVTVIAGKKTFRKHRK